LPLAGSGSGPIAGGLRPAGYGRVVGSLSPGWLPAAARAVADAIPGARYVTLEGQDHGVLSQPAALGPLLTDFLS
jgi:hypothetical protein